MDKILIRIKDTGQSKIWFSLIKFKFRNLKSVIIHFALL